MTDSPSIPPESWAVVCRSPLLVFHYVANADQTIDSVEVERLIDRFQVADEYGSGLFTRVVAELMTDPEKLARTVKSILESDSGQSRSEVEALCEILRVFSPDETAAFKNALIQFAMDIAVASGESDIPLSKEEWQEITTLKKLLQV